MRLDAALVHRGLAGSRTKAAALVHSGRVRVSGAVRQRPASQVFEEDTLEVLAGDDYVSRAAVKLKGVLDALGADAPEITGRRCLDVGASTGGFTQVLLQAGASQVIALDVGHDQLADTLRADPRVTVMEGHNARALTPEALPWLPEVIVADVSFISLTLILPALRRVCTDSTAVLVMVKPQFEVGRARLGSGGVVRDPRLRTQAVIDVAEAAHREGLGVRGVCASSLPGPHGNIEYFLSLAVAPGSLPVLSEGQRQEIRRSVEQDRAAGAAPGLIARRNPLVQQSTVRSAETITGGMQ